MRARPGAPIVAGDAVPGRSRAWPRLRPAGDNVPGYNRHFATWLLCALLVLTASATAQELQWRKYTNERHGFVLSYPSTLVAGPEAQNGSGREFHTRDKAFSLAVSAQFFHPDIGDTYEARWDEELSSLGDTVTYKKKTHTWYVVSGVAKDGTEYYHKTMRKDGNWVAFHITYPHAQNAKYDKWVEEIAKRFVPFLDGEYDRLD